jgi:hypothetical protein
MVFLAALSLHMAFYDFCRVHDVHETLRATPAMALGITNHIWTIAELIDAALAAPTAPTMPPKPPTTMRPARGHPPLIRSAVWVPAQ